MYTKTFNAVSNNGFNPVLGSIPPLPFNRIGRYMAFGFMAKILILSQYILGQSSDKDFDRSNITVDPLELKLFALKGLVGLYNDF